MDSLILHTTTLLGVKDVQQMLDSGLSQLAPAIERVLTT